MGCPPHCSTRVIEVPVPATHLLTADQAAAQYDTRQKKYQHQPANKKSKNGSSQQALASTSELGMLQLLLPCWRWVLLLVLLRAIGLVTLCFAPEIGLPSRSKAAACIICWECQL